MKWEISNSPTNKFKEAAIRMFNKLESRVEELRKLFTKEIESVIQNQI